MATLGCCVSIASSLFPPVIIARHQMDASCKGGSRRLGCTKMDFRKMVSCDYDLFSYPRRSKYMVCGGVLQSLCALQPLPKEELIEAKAVDNVEVFSLTFQRSDVRSLGGKYIVQEAVLDEEYWAAAWLRAESYSDEQPYFRYIENYRKKFAEQEFTALKRRCFGRQGLSIRCICLVAITLEETADKLGRFSPHTLRDRVVGTLDISVRQLLRGEAFPREVISSSQLTAMEPERRCGYIANVCVAKSARRQGIASSLMEAAIHTAKSWRLKNLYVHVNIGNIAARSLYMKLGFKVVEDDSSQSSSGKAQLLSMCI